MKKIIASALGLMMVGGVAASTASAVESKFGGYWRLRSYYQDEFKQNGESRFTIDSRTRLYYTAKFNDNFKFVNKFEVNTNWGDGNGGDIGADGTKIWRIKQSYADFTLGAVRTKLGIQQLRIGKDFLFWDDFSGITIAPKFGNVTMELAYIAEKMEDTGKEDYDESMALARAKVKIGDGMKLTPTLLYWFANSGVNDDGAAVGDFDLYYLGADFDMKIDKIKAWASLYYNGGEKQGADVSAWLAAANVNAGIAHGTVIYASGQDDDEDITKFQSPAGSWYTKLAEIMTRGIFDMGDTKSNGAPGDNITNLIAFKGGVTLKPMDKMKITADVIYAMLAEEDANGEDELGWEFDGKLTYKLMDNLTADFVLAYLLAGDATGDEDVTEAGVRVSLKF